MRQSHWDRVYGAKTAGEPSWFEPVPAMSLRLIESSGLTRTTCVLDVGGGDSHLVDELVARGVRCLAVLDISDAALRRARERLAGVSPQPAWIVADVTSDDWS